MRKYDKHAHIAKLQKRIEIEQRRIARYEKGIAELKHGRYDAIERVKEHLNDTRYVTKKGNIRKNLKASDVKALENYFNATFKNKESEYNKVKTVKARTQQRPHVRKNLEEKYNLSRKDAESYIKNVLTIQNEYMQDRLAISSDQIMSLTETFDKITHEVVKKTAEYIIKEKEEKLPSFMEVYAGEDADFELMYDVVEVINNMPEIDRESELDIDKIANALIKKKKRKKKKRGKF